MNDKKLKQKFKNEFGATVEEFIDSDLKTEQELNENMEKIKRTEKEEYKMEVEKD